MKCRLTIGNGLWLLWKSLSFIKVGNNLLSVFGVLWLVIEVFTFFNKQEIVNQIKEFWGLFDFYWNNNSDLSKLA